MLDCCTVMMADDFPLSEIIESLPLSPAKIN